MSFEPRRKIPGLEPEAERALGEIQTAIARECKRIEKSAERPRRRVTELVEEGSVIAKPGQVVRVQPGDEDVTVVLPEPSPASDGEDIVISFEGDGTATGKVLVVPANGTCLLPGVQTLNAPGTYRFTSTGGGATPKPRSNVVPVDTSAPQGGVWSGPPPVTVDDLPPIDTDSLVENAVDNTILDDMPGNSVKVNSSSATGNPSDLVIPANTVLGRKGGDIVAEQVSTGQITDDAVTNAKLADMAANSVKVNATTGSANPTDLAIGTNAVLGRVAGNIVAAQVVTAQIADDAVTNAKLADMAAGTVKGRQIDAGTGDPVDLIGGEIAEIIRWANITPEATGGTFNDFALDTLTDQWRFTATSTVNGVAGGSEGREFIIENAAAAGSGVTVTVNHFNTGSTAANRFINPDNVALLLLPSSVARFRYVSSRWRCVGCTGTVAALRDGDKGDITVTVSGTVWTIDNDVVSDAKLRNSAALSVIGRSANTTGDPADIAGTASSDAVLRISGTTLGFGTIATAGIADDAVTNAKLRNSGALSVIGRSANSSGDPADISASAASGAVLRESGSVLGFGTIATAGLADDSVTDAKLRNSGALSVIGRSANSSGDPADISASAASDAVLRESGSTVGFGTIATGGIANNAVTDAKLRDSGALSVIGRSANSSGDPADISATAASDAVLRESGSVIGWGTIATGGLADDSVTNAKLANMAANTVKVNATTSTADPTDLAINDVSVLGRMGIAGTGNLEPITVPGTGTSTGETMVLKATSARTALRFTNLTLIDLPLISDNRFVGNISGASARPIYTDFGSLSSATVSYENVGKTFIREALTGDVTAAQNSNATTITNGAVTNAKLRNSDSLSVIGNPTNSSTVPADIAAANDGEVLRRSGTTLGFGTIATAGIADDAVTNAKLRNSAALSIIGRSANSSGDPADIAATAASGAVLRESGSVLGFGTIATAGIGDAAVTLAKLANLAAGAIIGRQIDAGTGVPVALVGSEIAEIIRWANITTEAVGGTFTNHALDTLTDVWNFTATSVITGVAGGTAGRWLRIYNGAAAGSGITVTINQFDGASSSGNRFLNRDASNIVLDPGGAASYFYEGSRWKNYSVAGASTLSDSDKGDITVSASGKTWTVDNDVVSDAKLRNSGALSVIGRSANSSGDPADISASAASGAVLRESGSVLGFGTIATAGIADAAVTLAKLATIADNRFLGNISGATAAVAAVDLGSLNSTSIIYESTGKTFIRQALTGDVTAAQNSNATTIANGAVSNAKLRNSASLSVIGNATNASTVPADIAAANDGEVLRRSGTTLGFGTVATAGIADDAVTNAKLANMAQATLKGRAAGAGTGDPTDLALDTTVQRCIQISYSSAAASGVTQALPTGCTWFKVIMKAGGGGGGGADAETNGEVSAGGGGGEGCEVEVWYPAVGASITSITIGAGGTQGNNAGSSGANGTASTFTHNGETYTADPGQGGIGTVAGAGAGTGATVNMRGVFGGVGGTPSAAGAGHIYFAAKSGQSGFPGTMYGSGTTVANAIAIGGNGGGVGGGRGAMVQGGAGTGNGQIGGGATYYAGGGGSGGARIVAATGAATGATGGTGSDGFMRIEFYSGPLPVADGL